jgi:hypothetical protein
MAFFDEAPDACGHRRRQLQATAQLALRVRLDVEPTAVGVELRVQHHDRAADGQDPAGSVQITAARLGQFAPAQPGVDRHLDQQPGLLVRQRGVDRLELLERDTMRNALRGAVGVLTPRHGCSWTTPSFRAVVKIADRTVLVPDGGGGGGLGRGPVADPLPHVAGQDRVGPHRAEERHEVLVDGVPVALVRAQLQHVVQEPDLVDGAPERQLADVGALAVRAFGRRSPAWTPASNGAHGCSFGCSFR